MGWQRVATVVILALAVGFSTYIVGPLLNAGAPAADPTGPGIVGIKAGDVAPPFTLDGVGGWPTRLRSLRGRAVWLNFWATWCPWCRREMPGMETLSKRFRGRLVVVGIDERESASTLREYLDARGITYRVLLDRTGRVGTRYDVAGLPVSVFIAPDGRITTYYPGSLLGTKTMLSLVNEAMTAR